MFSRKRCDVPALLHVALMGAQGDGSMDTSSGAPQVYPSTPGLYHLTTQADGHTVYYTLRIPAGYDGHTALPVILCLHFGVQGHSHCASAIRGQLSSLYNAASTG